MYDESTQKNGPLSELVAEKITFPGLTYGETSIRVDISIYRIASLLLITTHLIFNIFYKFE